MRTTMIAFSVAFIATAAMAKPVIRSESHSASTIVEHEPYTSASSPAYTSIVSDPVTRIVSEPATSIETEASSFFQSSPYTSIVSGLHTYTGSVSSVAAPVQTNINSHTHSFEYTSVLSSVSDTQPQPTSVSSWLPSSAVPTSISSSGIINSTSTLKSSDSAPWPTLSNIHSASVTTIITGSPASYTSIISANGAEANPTSYTSFESVPTQSAI
ncbi:hypothetical protein RSOLAG1IB_02454 [Rhizoctonia solani AG-1 IB]|uniref:Uncharacterized protein n=2 Tax=Rhizoctonia solani TaxID=456999 RepID=A0A8H2XFL3_9AGAM|nr:unnamed protein product [Rhizoctonia solani]CEL57710.1 hypothetical protein RSOLAG1IB_02454 [Rhizoctonia solani AG-1 IB]